MTPTATKTIEDMSADQRKQLIDAAVIHVARLLYHTGRQPFMREAVEIAKGTINTLVSAADKLADEKATPVVLDVNAQEAERRITRVLRRMEAECPEAPPRPDWLRQVLHEELGLAELLQDRDEWLGAALMAEACADAAERSEGELFKENANLRKAVDNAHTCSNIRL